MLVQLGGNGFRGLQTVDLPHRQSKGDGQLRRHPPVREIARRHDESFPLDQFDMAQALERSHLIERGEILHGQQPAGGFRPRRDNGLLATHARSLPRCETRTYPSSNASIAAVTCSMSAMPSTLATSPRAS